MKRAGVSSVTVLAAPVPYCLSLRAATAGERLTDTDKSESCTVGLSPKDKTGLARLEQIARVALDGAAFAIGEVDGSVAG